MELVYLLRITGCWRSWQWRSGVRYKIPLWYKFFLWKPHASSLLEFLFDKAINLDHMASPFLSDTDLGNFITQCVVLFPWRPQATSAILYRSLAKQISFHGKNVAHIATWKDSLGKTRQSRDWTSPSPCHNVWDWVCPPSTNSLINYTKECILDTERRHCMIMISGGNWRK